MCSVEKTKQGFKLSMPNWLAGLLGTAFIGWMGWVSIVTINNQIEIKKGQRFTSEQHIKYVQQHDAADAAYKLLLKDALFEIKSEVSKVPVQIKAIQVTQEDIKQDVRDLRESIENK